MCNFPVPEFHDADGVERPLIIKENIFSDPKVACTENFPNLEAFLTGLCGAVNLNVVPAAKAFARLRIIQRGGGVVDVMLDLDVIGVRSRLVLF